MVKPHLVLIPIPQQGHVIPLLEVAQCLVDTKKFKITFVNTESVHEKLMSSIAEGDDVRDRINFVAFPDGMEPWEDRNDLKKLFDGIFRIMPGKLEELIKEINLSGDGKVVCVIADLNMSWALEVAKKMQIKGAAFWIEGAAGLALGLSIQKLIDNGIIDNYGTPLKSQMIGLSPTMPPAMKTSVVPWIHTLGNKTYQETFFNMYVKYNKDVKIADRIIRNSAYELEPEVFSGFPTIIPIGPLLASNRLANTAGNFWPEDSSCLQWLDQQEANSVIYVSFGSITIFNKTQFRELATGLELSNKPFLWVVRPDLIDQSDESAYPVGFKERVGNRGRIVSWAPQQKVLSHPSIACFLSHCGWNSTMEGISNGIPFLCWPYFCDQFLDQAYICDVWKVGLRLNKDECGIVRREEITYKVQRLLSDKTFRAIAKNLKEAAGRSVKEGGSSHKNFGNLIEWMKAYACAITNLYLPCALEVAKKMQVKGAAFWIAAAAGLALGLSIPKTVLSGSIQTMIDDKQSQFPTNCDCLDLHSSQVVGGSQASMRTTGFISNLQ